MERGELTLPRIRANPIGAEIMLMPKKSSTVLFDGSTHFFAGSSVISSGVRTAEPLPACRESLPTVEDFLSQTLS